MKQICVKTLRGDIQNIFKEANKYLENLGFTKTPLFAYTDQEETKRLVSFKQNNEQVLIEYKKDHIEEVLTIKFFPSEISFIYDILLMRCNQVANEQYGQVFVFEN